LSSVNFRRHPCSEKRLVVMSERSSSPIDWVLKTTFCFDEFRPRQREVCLSAWRGNDVLLVMPTGSGKSLCYQLPTVARQDSRTLVISPLIALIEDQVAKLAALGLSAGRIHSGLDRAQSNRVCQMWREGQLQFLFVAPERLGVPGFMSFLENHKPSLVAIDEAHCISMWGHDFRSEYRSLGERLARLRPANFVALTATATPDVQKDIVSQLRMKQPDIFIHGFRRDNIAISIHKIFPEQRLEALASILEDRLRLPCLVYAPTRKIAELTAAKLEERFSIKAFHAGMPPDERRNVQSMFMRGDLDAVVATNAFGMGIDKSNVRTVVHLAASGSLEAYYQEIGRAGRDGLPSRAIMMHAAIDKKTLDFFLEQNYPQPAVMRRVFEMVERGTSNREYISEELGLPVELARNALEKLWVHGGICLSENGQWVVDGLEWEDSYQKQRYHRQEQLLKALSFPDQKTCRMGYLVEHFGDHTDKSEQCGICDRCLSSSRAGASSLVQMSGDDSAAHDLMLMLVAFQSKGSGQLYREVFEKLNWDRQKYETIT